MLNDRLQEIVQTASTINASDIHLAAGGPVHFRVEGELKPDDSLGVLEKGWLEKVAASLLNETQQSQLVQRGSADGAFSWNGHRFRYNAFRRESDTCFSIRRLADAIPSLKELGIDERLYDVCELKDGLVLIAGPTGSGKSTTLAALVDRINQTRAGHIVTIEDPIEFLHPSKKSLVNQRQVGSDVPTFHQALTDAMRQDPDVILVGELRDLDTIRTAVTAAETGHLVFGTVHAADTKTVVERLVSAYAPEEQNLAQRLVATVLRTVVVQHLLPSQSKPDADSDAKRRRVLASERVHVDIGIASLIRQGKLERIISMIQSSGKNDIWTLDESLAQLLRNGLISELTARSLARHPETLGQLARVRR